MNPASFRLNAMLVYLSLLVDVFVGAYADVNYTSKSQLDVMAFIFQTCAFLLTVMCFYNMLGETNLVKRSLFSKLLREFAPACLAGVAYLALILAARFYRLVLVYRSVPHLVVWDEPAFAPLHVVMKLSAAAYYGTVVWSMQKLFASPELIATKAAYLSVAPDHSPRGRR